MVSPTDLAYPAQGVNTVTMRRLMFWIEVGLSERGAAEARFQRALCDRNPVAFNEIDARLQVFASDVHAVVPDIRFGGPGFDSEPDAASSAECYSQEGLVLELGASLPATTVAKVYAFGDPLGLTMYDPQAGFVLGTDDDLGIELSE